MTAYSWIGLVIAAGYFGWQIEHRRWVKPNKRHSVYVRDHDLARDQVFLDGRRATAVKGGDNSEQHRDGERWPASGANARSVWNIATEPTPFAHFATWPQKLVSRMILAGCPEGGTVLDPFGGSGTTALVARKLGRRSILIELNESYCRLASDRLVQQPLFLEVPA